MADQLDTIVPKLGKQTGSQLVFEKDPERLITLCIEQYRAGHFRRPSTFVADAGA
jgi:hypothetical protein